MIDLKNTEVIHKAFGKGIIIEQNEQYITVEFPEGTKKFQYPESFENFIKSSDEMLQEKVVAELIEKKELERQQLAEKQKLQKTVVTDKITHKSTKPKTYKKENIAFKCNFCDGGISKNGIGYLCPCSDDLIKYNIETAKHNWCCYEDAPCKKYYDGKIDRKTLDSYMESDTLVCYESQMLKNWRAFAGFSLTGENKQKPMRLNKVQVNSLAVLTTREPNSIENDRFIFAVFLVDDAYEGDNKEEGYVTTSSKYRIHFNLDEAKKIRFWDYYVNENAPDKIVWGQGLHRYLNDIQAAKLLKDIVEIKKTTKQYALAKEFFEYFCTANKIDIDLL